MKKNRIIYAVSALTLAVLLFIFLRKNRDLKVETVAPAVAIGGSVAPTGEKQIAKSGKEFPEAAQTEIQNCLGTSAGNFAELQSLITAKAGELQSDQVELKVVQFEDQSGQLFRVRLAREFTESGKSQLTLGLFSVDPEGLPDRVQLPPSEAMNPDLAALDRVLRNKRITNEVESHRYLYPDEKELIVERENGNLTKLQYAGGKIRLACETTPDSSSCHCVR
jgi:hypothetical protein